MNRKGKRKSKVYTYLRSTGVLENGSKVEIQNAKIEYYRKYKSEWRRKKRKTEKELTISVNTEELKDLTCEAKRHKLSLTKFIKQATRAYMYKTYIVPDRVEVKQVIQLLSMTYNLIQELQEEDNITIDLGRTLLDRVWRLEREVLPILHNPKSLEVYIQEHIEKSKKNKEQLIELINTL